MPADRRPCHWCADTGRLSVGAWGRVERCGACNPSLGMRLAERAGVAIGCAAAPLVALYAWRREGPAGGAGKERGR